MCNNVKKSYLFKKQNGWNKKTNINKLIILLIYIEKLNKLRLFKLKFIN